MMDIYTRPGFVIATEKHDTERSTYCVREWTAMTCRLGVDLIDADGAPIMESRHKMRWPLSDGTQLRSRAHQPQSGGESVWLYVRGDASYHCG
jgi:hypothetical protein